MTELKQWFLHFLLAVCLKFSSRFISLKSSVSKEQRWRNMLLALHFKEILHNQSLSKVTDTCRWILLFFVEVPFKWWKLIVCEVASLPHPLPPHTPVVYDWCPLSPVPIFNPHGWTRWGDNLLLAVHANVPMMWSGTLSQKFGCYLVIDGW